MRIFKLNILTDKSLDALVEDAKDEASNKVYRATNRQVGNLLYQNVRLKAGLFRTRRAYV